MTADLAQRIAMDYKGKTIDGYIVGDLHSVGGTSVVLRGSCGDEQVAINSMQKSSLMTQEPKRNASVGKLRLSTISMKTL